MALFRHFLALFGHFFGFFLPNFPKNSLGGVQIFRNFFFSEIFYRSDPIRPCPSGTGLDPSGPNLDPPGTGLGPVWDRSGTRSGTRFSTDFRPDFRPDLAPYLDPLVFTVGYFYRIQMVSVLFLTDSLL